MKIDILFENQYLVKQQARKIFKFEICYISKLLFNKLNAKKRKFNLHFHDLR